MLEGAGGFAGPFVLPPRARSEEDSGRGRDVVAFARFPDGDGGVIDDEGSSRFEEALLRREWLAVHDDGAEAVDPELQSVPADHGVDEADVGP